MPVALLDHAVEGYLAFRKDTGDRLKATLVAEPNSVRGQCLRGYLMMLFGQRAMVSRAQRPLDAAQAAARSVCVIRISGNFWTGVSLYLGHGSISGTSYGADEAGAQPTAQSERIKARSTANRFHAVSQASMMSARLINTELASQWLRR